jgi:hypothetical protein
VLEEVNYMVRFHKSALVNHREVRGRERTHCHATPNLLCSSGKKPSCHTFTFQFPFLLLSTKNGTYLRLNSNFRTIYSRVAIGWVTSAHRFIAQSSVFSHNNNSNITVLISVV